MMPSEDQICKKDPPEPAVLRDCNLWVTNCNTLISCEKADYMEK